MDDTTEHSILRWIHIVFGIPIGGCRLYPPSVNKEPKGPASPDTAMKPKLP